MYYKISGKYLNRIDFFKILSESNFEKLEQVVKNKRTKKQAEKI